MTTTTFTPLTEAELDRWIEGLRSGKYAQGRDQLATLDWNGEVSQYCCLGLKCELDGLNLLSEFGDGDGWYSLSGAAPNGALDTPDPLEGLSLRTRSTLAELNDHGHDFNMIADVLKDNRKALLDGQDLHIRYDDQGGAAVYATAPGGVA